MGIEWTVAGHGKEYPNLPGREQAFARSFVPSLAPTSTLPHTLTSKVALKRRELRPLYTSCRPWLQPPRQCPSNVLTIHKAGPPYASKPGISDGLDHWLQAANIGKRPRRGGLSEGSPKSSLIPSAGSQPQCRSGSCIPWEVASLGHPEDLWPVPRLRWRALSL